MPVFHRSTIRVESELCSRPKSLDLTTRHRERTLIFRLRHSEQAEMVICPLRVALREGLLGILASIVVENERMYFL
jgi:hypothetical protein